AKTLTELEDLYRPYRPKRRTRAMIAKERGLEPLAEILLAQKPGADPRALAGAFVDAEKQVPDIETALAGAQDIVAERMSDDASVRASLRRLYQRACVLKTQAATEEDSVYRMYYDYGEPLRVLPPHRVLAIDRGEKEGKLKVGLDVPAEEAVSEVEKPYKVYPPAPATPLIEATARDAYQRLIAPSLDNELRGDLTERAQEAAIRVFALNLRPLLLQRPVKGHVVLGLDPGIRTGCKVAVVDETGAVLDTGVIYPLPSHGKVDQARQTLTRMIRKHGVTIAAIGNGTASRETEQFFADLMHSLPELSLSYMVVSEAGASVYSASKLAAEEFPDYDVSLRSAVSIARRLQDPLAELVKIDPKAIGVGQYQHDLKPAALDAALDGVVEDCVNAVGVDLNTASAPLLRRVAGINSAIAVNIVTFRTENGAFRTRSQLKKVSKLGPRAFEQCAGFLRIPGGKDPLDNTGVHPESYAAAHALLERCGCTPAQAASGALQKAVDAIGLEKLAKEMEVGAPTLRDIVKELSKPGRDPRDELPPPLLRKDVLTMDDLAVGMSLQGTVRNVTDFGAFVDLGVHRDGLVHVSQMADRRVRHPSEVVAVGDVVTVRVLEVDKEKQRISLTMRSGPEN
ncbi:MAG TPA: Tex family protein, partial [Clostridia bacterium]|nr:Tex family protein [Clostridia bacterium]